MLSTDGIIPTNNMNSGSGPHAIPGWNERVKSAHALARDMLSSAGSLQAKLDRVQSTRR